MAAEEDPVKQWERDAGDENCHIQRKINNVPCICDPKGSAALTKLARSSLSAGPSCPISRPVPFL
jgi:hypothetical protein